MQKTAYERRISDWSSDVCSSDLQTASCGPLRKNSPQIPDSQGFSYKCLVAPHLSRRIIDDVRPVYVFSGDDHDQCAVLHSSTEPTRARQSVEKGTRGSVRRVIGGSRIIKKKKQSPSTNTI